MGILKIVLVVIGIALVIFAAVQWIMNRRRMAIIGIIASLVMLSAGVGWMLYPNLAREQNANSQPTAGVDHRNDAGTDQAVTTTTDVSQASEQTGGGDTDLDTATNSQFSAGNPVIYYSNSSEIKKPDLLISDKKQSQLALVDDEKADSDDQVKPDDNSAVNDGADTLPTEPTTPSIPTEPSTPADPIDGGSVDTGGGATEPEPPADSEEPKAPEQPAEPTLSERVDGITNAVVSLIDQKMGDYDQYSPQSIALWGVENAPQIEALAIGESIDRVHANLNDLVHQMVANDIVADDVSVDEVYKTKAIDNVDKIIRALIWTDRAYGLADVSGEALNAVRFTPEEFTETGSSLDWLIKIGSLTYDDYLPVNTQQAHGKIFTDTENLDYLAFIDKLKKTNND